MATWKRLRALEAAARAGDAAARRELARAAREQQTLQATLGAVDRLVSAAPQLSQAYSSAIAEDILSGKKAPGAPKPGEDDILGQIGAFIREPWRAQGEKMARAQAAQMAPQELAKIRPLLREEFGKKVEPEVPGMEPSTPQQRIRAEVERSRPLSLLDEQQRQAIVAGEMQRFQREAEEQAKEDQLMQAQLAKLAPKAEQVKPESIDVVAKAVTAQIAGQAGELRQALNDRTGPEYVAAVNQLNDMAKNAASQLKTNTGDPIDFETPYGLAVLQEVQSKVSDQLKLKPLTPDDLKGLSKAKETITELASIIEDRDKVKFEPDKIEIMRRYVINKLGLPFKLETVLTAYGDGAFRKELNADQLAWMNRAFLQRQRLTTEEFRGTGAISDFERKSIQDFIGMNPFSTREEWRAENIPLLRKFASGFASNVSSIGSSWGIPPDIRNFAVKMSEATQAFEKNREAQLAKTLRSDIGVMTKEPFGVGPAEATGTLIGQTMAALPTVAVTAAKEAGTGTIKNLRSVYNSVASSLGLPAWSDAPKSDADVFTVQDGSPSGREMTRKQILEFIAQNGRNQAVMNAVIAANPDIAEEFKVEIENAAK